MELSAEQKRILALTIAGEAAGESHAGKVAVAWVLRNRAESGRFPSDPAAVALQKNSRGTHAFSTWNSIKKGGNDPAKFVGTKAYSDGLKAIDEVFGDKTPDPTRGAQYYYAHGSMKAPAYFDKVATAGTTTIGGHTFASTHSGETANVPLPQSRPREGRGPSTFQNGIEAFSVDAGRPITADLNNAQVLISRKVQSIPIGEDGNPIVPGRITVTDVQRAVTALAKVKAQQLDFSSAHRAGNVEPSPAPLPGDQPRPAYGTTDPMSINYRHGQAATPLPAPAFHQELNNSPHQTGQTLAQQAVIDGGADALRPQHSAGNLDSHAGNSAPVSTNNGGMVDRGPAYTTTYPVIDPNHPKPLLPGQIPPASTVKPQVQNPVPNDPTRTYQIQSPTRTLVAPPAPSNGSGYSGGGGGGGGGGSGGAQMVTIASGHTVPVGTTGSAQSGKYTYTVQSDGSIVNNLGRVTAPAPNKKAA